MPSYHPKTTRHGRSLGESRTKKNILGRALALTALTLVSPASAALLNVDFNGGFSGTDVGPSHTGPAVVGGFGDQWNGVQADTPLPLALHDATGAATGVTLTLSHPNQQFFGGMANADNPFVGSAGALMRDYAFATTEPQTITLAGLEAGAAFTLHVYSSSDNSRWTEVSLAEANGGEVRTIFFDRTHPAAVGFGFSLNYQVLRGVADSQGRVIFSFRPSPRTDFVTTEGDLNGFQLEILPGQPSASDPALVFKDRFLNSTPTDADTEPAMWTPQPYADSTITESGGALRLSAGGAAAGEAFAGAATAVSGRFNFFDRPLEFSGSVTVGPSDAADTVHRRARLVLASAGGSTSPNDAPSALALRFFVQNAVALDAKTARPGLDPNNSDEPGAATPLIVTGNGGNSASFPFFSYTHRFSLALDAQRFRLTTNVTADGALRARLSGAHGLERSSWGGAGDAALHLQAWRTAAAPAGSAATAAWSDLGVRSDPAPILDEPIYDFPLDYTVPNRTGTGHFRLWVPRTEPIIRGVLLVAPGTGLDYRHLVLDPTVQEAARSLGFAVIAFSNDPSSVFGHWVPYDSHPVEMRATFQALFDRAAELSGHPEISQAPLCSVGFSLGAANSVHLAKVWPERMITYVAHNYGSPAPSIPPSAETLAVPGLFIARTLDPVVPPATMTNFWRGWRSLGAPVALAFDWRVGHELTGNQGWEATWAWLIETTNRRYPRPLAPTAMRGVYPPLVALAPESGWLGENPRLALEPSSSFLNIQPAPSYPGAVLDASWFPGETSARTARALSSTDGLVRQEMPFQSPLRFVSPALNADPVVLGRSVSLVLDPREFDDERAIASIEIYESEALIATLGASSDWRFEFAPQRVGLHSLSAVATDSEGNKTSAFRALYVVNSDYAPLAEAAEFAGFAGQSLTASVRALDPEGRPLRFIVDAAPEHGRLALDAATGAFVYQPAHGFAGVDTFTYRADTGAGTASSEPRTVSLTISPPADLDGSGLPAAWKLLHGITDVQADADGDGSNNYQEYLAMTDPRDPSDRLPLVNLSREADGWELRWPAKGTVRYRVQGSVDLQSWHDFVRAAALEVAPGEPGAPSEISFRDDGALWPQPPDGNRRFYRLRILP